ncbi:unnamed protein product, partial [Polarella glacialis]
ASLDALVVALQRASKQELLLARAELSQTLADLTERLRSLGYDPAVEAQVVEEVMMDQVVEDDLRKKGYNPLGSGPPAEDNFTFTFGEDEEASLSAVVEADMARGSAPTDLDDEAQDRRSEDAEEGSVDGGRQFPEDQAKSESDEQAEEVDGDDKSLQDGDQGFLVIQSSSSSSGLSSGTESRTMRRPTWYPVAGRLQGAPQKIALRLRLPRPVAAGGGYDIGDEVLIRLSQEQVIDPATNTIVQEYIPSGLQFLCQALRAIYGLQDQEFDHRYESAEDEAGLQMNDTGKTYFFLRGSGLGDKIIEDIKLQMRGDMSRYQEIRTLVLKLARANDKDKETLNMYQDQTDFNYKVNLDETNGNYYGSWHDPTTGEIIEYDYGANTSDDMYYGDYDYVYDGEYSDYDGAGYDDDWYGDDGWQDEVYHGDFPLEEWTWPASAPDSSTVSTAETTLLDVDPSYWKGQTKGKGKGFGAKGKGPSGGSASGIGCATCGSRWHSSLDCPLNDPSKGGQGKGKGGKDYHYKNFWKGKGKGKKGGKSKGFGKGWSKGFGKYRPSFGSGKGYGKYSGGYGKSYGKSYGKGKFKGGYGGLRYSSPYNFTAFQDHEVQEALEHAPTIAFKADGSCTQYYDFDDEKPSSSTRPPPQSTTEPMIDTAGNLGYNDGYGEIDTAPAPMPDVRVNSLSFLVGACSSAFPTDHEDWSSLYHSVRGVKRHGLLIDPGAASGLIGSDTLKEFRDEILLPLGVDIICRPTTQNVSGISGKPEPALSRVTMPIFPGIKSSTFTADVIGKQGSKCPALLPNPSMRAANMGLLTNFFENGDGMLIVHDNGKRLLYRCLLTESGHYILPTDNVKNNNNVDKEATRKASAFYAAVLHDATQQWSDINAVYLAVDKAAVADPVADR